MSKKKSGFLVCCSFFIEIRVYKNHFSFYLLLSFAEKIFYQYSRWFLVASAVENWVWIVGVLSDFVQEVDQEFDEDKESSTER